MMGTYMALLLCGLLFAGIQAKDLISLEDPIRVALRGEGLVFNFMVEIKVNQSASPFQCFHHGTLIYKTNIAESDSNLVPLKMPFVNSSNSGEYYCMYKKVKMYFILLVRDEGYRDQPEEKGHFSLLIWIFTIILIVFSIVGSVVVFKDCRDIFPTTLSKNEENVAQSMETSGGSVYMSLDHGASSIYNVLQPNQKQKTNEKDTKESACVSLSPRGSNVTMDHLPEKEKTAKDEEIFESVYENY